MNTLLTSIDRFFFRKISASGFGLMRISWALVSLAYLLQGLPDVVRYYSEDGLLPESLGYLVFRTDYRFTLLNVITDPTAVFILYLLLIISTCYMLIGMWPRLMTIISVVLLCSFHERNLQPLGGGDTVLRLVGFILMIAPEIRAFSFDRAEEQWKHWKVRGILLDPLKMSIWPYRLLLWQILLIYITSGIDKLTGTMWTDGTVVGAVLHHPHFARFPMWWMDILSVLSPFFGYSWLLFEFTWFLLLIPKNVTRIVPMSLRKHSLKRWLILFGVLYHGGICILMDVGSFSFAMFTIYLGLLVDEDWVVIRTTINRKWKGSIIVLYDGVCHLCQRGAFLVLLLDNLHRLSLIDFRDSAAKKKVAPELHEEDLDRALHIKLPSGKTRQGFDAFQALCWHLPILWLKVPFLYFPGVAPIGRLVYGKIAENRNKCSDGKCKHK